MPAMIQSMAHLVMDRTLSTKGESIGARLARRALRLARQRLKRRDPLLTYRFRGFDLQIAFSHNLLHGQTRVGNCLEEERN